VGKGLMHRFWAEIACALLLAVMAANLLTAITRKTITNDEILFIPAGYYHLTGKFQFNNEHPPLAKMWGALPLLILKPVIPPPPQTVEADRFESVWGFHARFWDANPARFRTLALWPRVWMVPVTLALGALIFWFARKLFGPRAAVLAVALYVFEPTMLAHGRIVHTDVAAALAYLAFFVVLHAYWVEPTGRRAAGLGIVTGLALLTKFSLIVLAPVLAVAMLTLVYAAPSRALPRSLVVRHAALMLVVVLLIVNAGYYFQGQGLTEADVHRLSIRSAAHLDRWIAALSLGSHVLPTYFLFGQYNVWIHNTYGHPGSLFGVQSDLGWWYYFPIVFALKTTLPFLLVSIAALVWASFRLFVRRDARFFFLFVPVLIFTVGCMASHINIGIRHLLPVFPFLFIASGALLDKLLTDSTFAAPGLRRIAQVTVVAVLVGSAVEAARVFPDYIPYTNQLTGTRPHWRVVSDSNVEWGDDAKALAAYLKERGETRVRAATLGGWMTLRFLGIDYINLVVAPGTPLPPTRYVALGASFLNGSAVRAVDPAQPTTLFAPYRDRRPEAVFGNSIYLYREE
jgi:4-amino-4-deoxy-L-arabinose transferase-like glycosyltransferase